MHDHVKDWNDFFFAIPIIFTKFKNMINNLSTLLGRRQQTQQYRLPWSG